MRLSALAIRNAKTREKACELGDGHGLYLLVKPSGTLLCLVSVHVHPCSPQCARNFHEALVAPEPCLGELLAAAFP